MDENVFWLGKKGRDFRKQKIYDLLSSVKGKRGWRNEFFKMYPQLDNSETVNIINRGSMGTCDDPEFLKLLEEFTSWVEKTNPDWYKTESVAT